MYILKDAYNQLKSHGVCLSEESTEHPVDFLREFYEYEFISGIRYNNGRCFKREHTESGRPFDSLESYGTIHAKGDFDIQPNVVITGNVILGNNVTIGPGTFLRGPLFIGDNTLIGPWSEIVRSVILSNSNLYHRNYMADSIVGNNVWMGSNVSTANVKIGNAPIKVSYNGVEKSTSKFGALITDGAVMGVLIHLMPGTQIDKERPIIRPCIVSDKHVYTPAYEREKRTR